VCGSAFEHAYSLNEKGATDKRLLKERHETGPSRIGVARFPKWRLFGFRAHPEGMLCLRPRVPTRPWDMYLNYRCEHDGHVEALLQNGPASETYGRAVRLENDATAAKLVWDDGARRAIAAGGEFTVLLALRHATVYAFELLQTSG
jgi:hypothetical protein